MANPNVTISEIDISVRAPSNTGVAAGIVVPAKKGSTTEATLVTSETGFLEQFTPDEKIAVGFDIAHYSARRFLKESNQLWVMRAHNAALFGGLVMLETGTSAANAALVTGLADPADYSFAADEAILIHGLNPGAWNNDISVIITTNETDSVKAPESNSFVLEVVKDGSVVETWTVSRDPAHLDGFGNNIFIETVLAASLYIGAVSNTAIGDTVQPKDQLTALSMAVGSDGSAVTDTNMSTALGFLTNKDDISIKLLLDGGWSTAAYHSALVTAAQTTRGDVATILSMPFASSTASSTSVAATQNVTYRTTTLNANSSYAALYTPHYKIADPFNDREIFIAPDGAVGGVIARTEREQEIWFPPAGFDRAILTDSIDVQTKFTDGDRDILHNNGINAIRFVKGRGTVVWGQKTLLSRPSALDRLNVRLLLVDIEPSIEETMENFVFELNDATTRNRVSRILTSFLERIQSRRGVTDFLVVSDTTNNTAVVIDNNELIVDIFIKPTKSAEFIKVRLVITAEGVSFSEEVV